MVRYHIRISVAEKVPVNCLRHFVCMRLKSHGRRPGGEAYPSSTRTKVQLASWTIGIEKSFIRFLNERQSVEQMTKKENGSTWDKFGGLRCSADRKRSEAPDSNVIKIVRSHEPYLA